MSSSRPPTSTEYHIAWIAVLPPEIAAAKALFDQEHPQPADFTQDQKDCNAYSWGTISGHNIVVASLPSGVYGTTSATITAQQLSFSLPSIKIGLLVGIGAGIIESGLDIRLGDVAVSEPQGTNPGVLQYDFGKAKANGHWEARGSLPKPPPALLNAMGQLRAEHELRESQIPVILEEAGQRNVHFAKRFLRPGINNRVFHVWNDQTMTEEETCYPERDTSIPKIHYGIIASGNKVVKDAQARAAIYATHKASGHSCICLEMEAAGVMDTLPSLVVRGISDYADSHKNDDWHRYASATAAAFAKELLRYVPRFVSNRTQDHERSKLMQALDTCPYRERKDRNPTRVEGTCKWFVSHSKFQNWQNGSEPGLLWMSGDPGCGKSVLARYLVDNVLQQSNKTVCYFFFKDDFTDQNNSADAMCALLRQLMESHPEIITSEMIQKFNDDKNSYVTSFRTLWEEFIDASRRARTDQIVCVLDALDECQAKDRQNLIRSICEYAQDFSGVSKVKYLMTSRPYIGIQDDFYDFEETWPTIHLNGEDDEEVQLISQEISDVVRHRIRQFSRKRRLTPDEEKFLLDQYMSQTQRTYLWVDLTLKAIESAPESSKGSISKTIEQLPTTLDEAYNRILDRGMDQGKAKAKLLLQLIIAAQRPFTLDELSRMVALHENQKDFAELDNYVEPEHRFKTTIRNLSGFLLVVVNSRVYLLHQTAREFLIGKETNKMAGSNAIDEPRSTTSLVWKASLPLQACHRTLAERCLWLLAPRALSKQLVDTSILALLEYSNYFWPSHFNASKIIPGDHLFELAVAHSYIMRPYYRKLWGIMDGAEISEHELHMREMEQLDGDRYLNCLSFVGLSEIIRWLLDNATFTTGRKHVLSRALIWASLGGNKDTAELLLKFGASPNSDVPSEGQPFDRILNIPQSQMLRSSHESSQPDSVSGLIKPPHVLPGLISITPLHSAVHLQDQELIISLLNAGAQTNTRSVFANRTPLYFAARLGNEAIVELLLENGANKKLGDKVGCSPAEYFFIFGTHGKNCEVILRLLWYNPPSITNNQRLLWLTSGRDCNTCVSFTIQHSSTNDRQRALLLASQQGRSDIVKLLLEAGADANYSGKDKITPLMHAVSRLDGSGHLTKLLLLYGADIHAVDGTGASCIHYVRNEEALKILLLYKTDINAKDYNGVTPLMSTVLDQGRNTFYETMLKNGAKPDDKDKYGLSAQTLALPESTHGGFSATSFEVYVDAQMILHAECCTIRSTYIPSSIDLSDCLGNASGTFQWRHHGNFLTSARNVRIANKGKVLIAELKTITDAWKLAYVWLDERIVNRDGELQFLHTV